MSLYSTYMAATHITTAAEAHARIEFLAEDLPYAWEAYGENLAQHRSETAAFGDSWPGAQIELAHAKAAIEASEAELATLEALFPVYGPTAADRPHQHACGWCGAPVWVAGFFFGPVYCDDHCRDAEPF